MRAEHNKACSVNPSCRPPYTGGMCFGQMNGADVYGARAHCVELGVRRSTTRAWLSDSVQCPTALGPMVLIPIMFQWAWLWNGPVPPATHPPTHPPCDTRQRPFQSALVPREQVVVPHRPRHQRRLSQAAGGGRGAAAAGPGRPLLAPACRGLRCSPTSVAGAAAGCVSVAINVAAAAAAAVAEVG